MSGIVVVIMKLKCSLFTRGDYILYRRETVKLNGVSVIKPDQVQFACKTSDNVRCP